jgi:hypothetical protein
MYQYSARKQPLDGFWSFINDAIPASKILYDARTEEIKDAITEETPGGAQFWDPVMKVYLTAEQKMLADKAAAEKAEAEKLKEGVKAGGGLPPTTMLAIAAGVYFVFFR